MSILAREPFSRFISTNLICSGVTGGSLEDAALRGGVVGRSLMIVGIVTEVAQTLPYRT